MECGEGIERDLGADPIRSPQGSRTQLTGREGMCLLLTVQPLPILPLPLSSPPPPGPSSGDHQYVVLSLNLFLFSFFFLAK